MAEEFKKLFIVIGARNDEFKKGLKEVEKGLKKFEGLAKTALGAGTAIAAGIGASVKQYADLGSEIYDMSKKTGLGARTISQLKYAAEQSGASIATLDTAVKRMQKTLYDASKGTKSANDALNALGLKIEDVIDLSPDEQFEKIMQALAGIEDPTLRAGAAMEIFGRSGTDMLPMLDGGIEGLNALKEAASKTGAVFSDEAAVKADQFGDSLGKLQASLSGVALVVADKLMPALQPLIDKLIVVIQNVAEWIGKNPQLAQGAMVLSGVLIGAGGLFYAIKSIVDVLKSMAIAMTVVQALQGPKGWITLGISLAALGGMTYGLSELLKTPEPQNAYASGGIAWTPQIASLAEREPEAIIPLRQLSALGGEIHNHLYIDGEEITDVIERRMYSRIEAQEVTEY